MKKTVGFITILTALTLGGFAKNATDLTSEYKVLKDKGNSQWVAGRMVFENNLASDIASVYETWKDTPIAKFLPNEHPNKNLTNEQKEESIALRAIFAHYLITNPIEMEKVPVRVACLTVASRYIDAISKVNPTFYSDLKNAKFVVDGVILPAYSRFNLAKSAGDIEYISSAAVEDGMCAPDVYITVMIHSLLENKDINMAKKKCTEIENYMLTNNMSLSPYLSKIQAVNRTLTSRLIDLKLQGN